MVFFGLSLPASFLACLLSKRQRRVFLFLLLEIASCVVLAGCLFVRADVKILCPAFEDLLVNQG